MKRNTVKMLVTNVERYSEEELDNKITTILEEASRRMMCTLDIDAIAKTVAIEDHPWLGNVIEVNAPIKIRNDEDWGTIYSIHFHEALGIDGFYERQVVAALISRYRRILEEIKENKTHGLGLFDKLSASWGEFMLDQKKRMENPNHPIHKKACTEQILYSPKVIYDLLSPIVIQFISKRRVVIDVFETAVGNPRDRIFSITLSIFITSEKLEVAPSILLAKEKEKLH